MKDKFSRILCTAFCCAPLLATAQTGEEIHSPQRLYQEGRELFQQKAFAAARTPLRTYVSLSHRNGDPLPQEGSRMEAEYMLVCTEYELHNPQSDELLLAYLLQYPETPHADRIYALAASTHYFRQEYDAALALFNVARLDQLSAQERDDMTYRLATCYLKTGNLRQAAVWFKTLQNVSHRYEADCTYYLSYINYTQHQYDEALKGFLSIWKNQKYQRLTPYYVAEIYLQQKAYSQAAQIARDYLNLWPNELHATEMYRILGASYYQTGQYLEAVNAFKQYAQGRDPKQLRRDALYMYGLSCYHCQAYTQVPQLLGYVTGPQDALTQNAWYHIGLASLQLDDRNKARMAFEQAAASDADKKLQEQAAYNHALCVHETSYSAFGESVTVFEKFLNHFPNSRYADKASAYLVEVYMNTRSYEAALQSIERIAHPGNAILEAKQKILFQLGTQAFTNTQFEQAVGYFTQSLNLGNYNPQVKADAYYWRGESYYRLERMPQAASDFNEYLTHTPQRNSETAALAYYNLGYIAFHKKDYAVAQQRFGEFMRLQQQNNSTLLADACNRIGDCYMRNRAFAEARSYYQRAEQMNTPAGDYAYYQLALVAGLQKDYTGKVQLLNNLVNKYPNSPYMVKALYEKGRSYVQNNQTAQAIASFGELIKKYPESPVTRKAAAEIALLYYQSDDYNRAIDAYKYVVTRYPGSAEARLAMRDLKSIYVDANRVDEFAKLVSQLPGGITFEPSEQDSLTYIAAERVYMKGNKQGAKQSFSRYLQSFPEGAFSLNARYYLCSIAHEQHDEEEVLLQAGKLLEYPDNPYSEEALLMRAELLFNRHDYQQALTDYQQLQAKSVTAERRQLGATGVMRCARQLNDDVAVIHAATMLLSEAKLTPELRNEALYDRAKAYLNQKAVNKAMADLTLLAQDTRTLYGAEAKYLLAQQHYNAGRYAEAEKEVLNFIDQSTPHAYWLARSFILLSDVYVAMDKKLDARQYLLSLRQNYQGEDDIAQMIEERLEKLK